MQSISSRDNELVKKAVRIARLPAERTQHGLFFADGIKLCEDLAQIVRPNVIFVAREVLREKPGLETLGEETYLISEPVADKLAVTKNAQGLFGLFALPQHDICDIDINKGVLICEALQDPANVGAVVRSAAALGIGGVLLCGECANAFGTKALRASAGAVLRVPVISTQLQNAARQLIKQGVVIYAAATQNSVPIAKAEIVKKFAILVGNEGAGLSNKALELAQKRIHIPMHSGMESLNAAAAASILMYHFTL